MRTESTPFSIPLSNLGDNIAYAVVSVDKLGGRSGMTNLTVHETQAPPVETLGKVYVVPNPLFVTSGLSGADPGGEYPTGFSLWD
jgi:hypothetical protein